MRVSAHPGRPEVTLRDLRFPSVVVRPQRALVPTDQPIGLSLFCAGVHEIRLQAAVHGTFCVTEVTRVERLKETSVESEWRPTFLHGEGRCLRKLSLQFTRSRFTFLHSPPLTSKQLQLLEDEASLWILWIHCFSHFLNQPPTPCFQANPIS